MTYIYLAYVPSPPLNTYIDDFYYWQGPAPFHQMKVIPMPALHLMVNLGQPFQVYAPEQRIPVATCTTSWLVGQWNTYHTVVWPAEVRFYGIHFKAGGLYPFLRFPLLEINNQVVALEDVWGQRAADLREQLAVAPTIQIGFDLLERWLLSCLQVGNFGLDIVQYAIDQINRQQGRLSIRTLSDQIGISQNHLGTQFKRMVGISPKILSRLYRFAHIHRAIAAPMPSVDWVDLALQGGYYDQSHFNKDFIAFSGHSPTDYLSRLQQLHHADPDHNHLLRPLPFD